MKNGIRYLKTVLTTVSVSFLFLSTCWAQQGQTWSSYYENGFAFNPALTAYWDNVELTASHRKEWTSFDGAPVNTSVGVQIPILTKDFINTSAVGAFVDNDIVGPIESIGAKLTYAYRIVPNFQGNKLDQLKIGVGLNVRHKRFNMNNIQAFDGLTDDLSINLEETNPYSFSGSIGFFYISTDVDREYKPHYFMGISINNLSATKSNIESLGEITQSPFFTAHFGFRRLPTRRNFYVEPSIFASYNVDNEFLVMLNARIEFKKKYYISGGGDTNGGYFAQTGFIIAFRDHCRNKRGFSSQSKYNDSTDLRLGFKIGNRFGPISQFVGVNYELLLAYNFALCN